MEAIQHHKGSNNASTCVECDPPFEHSGCLGYGLERKRESPSHIDPVITGFIGELNDEKIPANLAAPENASN